MHVAAKKTLISLVMTALLASLPVSLSSVVAQEPAAELKWTPHRASMPSAEPATIEEVLVVEEIPVQEQRRLAPPASVSLPDGVPMADIPAPPVRRREASVPPRPPAARSTPPVLSEAMRNLYDPENPNAVFGIPVMRTPRGPASRPIFAAEGQEAVAMRAAADRAAPDNTRLGGGIAPRYAGRQAAAAERPERLAMNVDGIPSVMRQAPSQAPRDNGVGAGQADAGSNRLPTPAENGPGSNDLAFETESIGPGIEMPEQYDSEFEPSYGGAGAYGPEYGSEMADPGYDDGLLMGAYPTELHVESFYDDPYACEDDECLLPMCNSHGRICTWLRRFGKPYYGWRWYRDFTASAGITSFTNSTDLGINGNFGTNEYLNWSMPFWNAFGVGWQVGWRGTQTNFQSATIDVGNTTLRKNARDQNFLTTGFFTRAFEGRGMQGGIVYDYLSDSWFDNTDVSQLRYEVSYVWGYHELGFWGASNIGDQVGLFGPVTRSNGIASTLNLYTAFYRLQFGDANEWKVWAGGTGESDGIIGSLLRAPLHRSLAMEGTFTYVIPGRKQVINIDGRGDASSFSPAAWNVGLNLVWYPAGRSRRSLASPYRPLFEVADNGSMIRSIQPTQP